MKIIKLSDGQDCFVDDEDYESLLIYRWSPAKRNRTTYAKRNLSRRGLAPIGQRDSCYMHRMIMRSEKNVPIDHRDGNGLNNQKINLRTANPSSNGANSRKRRGSLSIYKGVGFHAGCGRWRAHITKGYKTFHLGHFLTEIEAAKAYDKAAIEIFGQFASLNFPIEIIQEKILERPSFNAADKKTSRFRGVHFDKSKGKFRARLNGSCLGDFVEEIEAAMAYDAKAIILFGESARLNFPSEISPA